jgi:mycofactocin glycosyltransferase
VDRSAVDVVVPYRGDAAGLEELSARLSALRTRPGDTVLLVDNTPRRSPLQGHGQVKVLHAPERATPGYARNRGVALGKAGWLLFFDADVVAPPDLIDRYFDPPPGERTALIGGGIVDEEVPEDAPPAARFAHIRELMSQDDTMRYGRWSFPKTANAAVRREAFEALGGFREDIRAAEDADLTYRLRAAGWEVERRERAAVIHLNRQTVSGLVRQKLLHGAGGAWLYERYPGAFPPRRRPGLVWWGVRTAAKGLVRAARTRDRDTALWAVFEPVEQLSYEFGRSLPNERPLRWRRLSPL